MNKDELLKLAEALFREAFDANLYFSVMQQYDTYLKEYENEMELSPAFYNAVINAMQVACFMELAKLYDKSRDAITIGSLLKNCENNISLFPEYRAVINTEIEGENITLHIPYKHELKPEEEIYFDVQVKRQRKFLKLFNVENTKEPPVEVELRFPEYLSLYQKRFCALGKKLKNIRIQRNKLYAHNDSKMLSEKDFLSQAKVYYSDIQELIEFALDATQLIISCLSGVCKARQYANIDDWKNTLICARLGLKYQSDE